MTINTPLSSTAADGLNQTRAFHSRHGLQGLRAPCPTQIANAQLADAFTGLPEGVTRWRLAAALRTAAQPLGLTSSMLRLLELYIDHTFDIDWAAGNEPIITRPLIEMAEQMGRSERQVRNIERSLAVRGLLIWRDSGNHHRKGRRDRNNHRLIYGYGPSLAPLASRAAEIIELAEATRRKTAEKRRYRIAISALRRRTIAALATVDEIHTILEDRQSCLIANLRLTFSTIPERNPAGTDIATLIDVHKRLETLVKQLEALITSTSYQEISGLPESHTTTNYLLPKDKSINGYCTQTPTKPSTSGKRRNRATQTITYKTATQAAGPMLTYALTQNANNDWKTLIDVAGQHAPMYGIEPPLWADACATMGRRNAALSVLMLERAMEIDRPGKAAPVRDPAAYFRALINRAYQGCLNLEKSILWLAQNSVPQHAKKTHDAYI